MNRLIPAARESHTLIRHLTSSTRYRPDDNLTTPLRERANGRTELLPTGRYPHYPAAGDQHVRCIAV